jgi:uncharacterized protein YbcC (UPF0753/DUF2309 family)
MRVLAGLLGAVLLLAGCGGNGPLTAREFRRDASRICRLGNARVERVRVAPLEDGIAAAHGLELVVAAHRQTLQDLRSLDAPKRDELVIEKWLAVVDQLLDQVDQARVALEAEDEARAEAGVRRALLLDDRARELAHDFGITPCRVRAKSLGL